MRNQQYVPTMPPNGNVALVPSVHLNGITKHFGAVKANQDITLDIYAGKVLALLGENGAGKSTLMSILAGRLAPDSGYIAIDGNVVRLRSPNDALRSGIGMVYQHFTLVESMTVAENIILGQEGGFLLKPAAIRQTVLDLGRRYGLSLEPDARVADLSMGEKQRVEIAKLLYRDSRVLILDEPTAVLTPPEAEQLFTSLRSMAKRGKAIVFISHKMQEVLAISDHIAILRRGRIVDSFDKKHVPGPADLANRMLGRELTAFEPPKPAKVGGIVMEGTKLSGKGLDNVSFTLRRGEILAIAGVAGNGQKELVETLCGLRQLEHGEVRMLAKDWHAMYPSAPRRGGLAYIPEDRLSRAVCPHFTLADNFLLTNRMEFSSANFLWPWLLRAPSDAAAAKIIDDYNVVGGLGSQARALSGGNLQKFVVGRELYRGPKVIIAENPTQGLDVAAMEDVWRQLLAARENAGIMLVTGDLTEALMLADRIAIMYQGRFMDCFSKNDSAKVDRIGLLMAGMP